LKRIDFAFGPKDAGMETLAETEQQPIKGVPAPKAARLCVFVCVCVCIGMCMCMYMYACMYIYVYICIYMHICVCVCMHVCIYMYTYILIHISLRPSSSLSRGFVRRRLLGCVFVCKL